MRESPGGDEAQSIHFEAAIAFWVSGQTKTQNEHTISSTILDEVKELVVRHPIVLEKFMQPQQNKNPCRDRNESVRDLQSRLEYNWYRILVRKSKSNWAVKSLVRQRLRR